MTEITSQQVLAVFPQGIILAWFVTSGQVPAGWAICDGSIGTPDLRGRFLRGVSDLADVGRTGGSEQHSHTNVRQDRSRPDGNGFQGEGDENRIGVTESQSHLPPFTTILYIMKL